MKKQVNETIARIHEDYCTMRRIFIGIGWMNRADGIYTVYGAIPGSDISKSLDLAAFSLKRLTNRLKSHKMYLYLFVE